MATEWFIQAFENGEEQNILVKDIMNILSDYIIEIGDNNVVIKLSDEKVNLFFEINEEEISDLTVSRPIENNELLEIIYKIMGLGNFILYAPNGEYPIILKSGIKNELPYDMIEAIGKPKVAINEIEFKKIINGIYGNE